MKFSTIVVSFAVGSASAFVPSSRSSGSAGGALLATVERLQESMPETSVMAPRTIVMEKADIPIVNESIMIEEAPVKTSTDIDFPVEATPNKNRIQQGRYNNKDTSIALPFMARPTTLDGTHAGDFGFDPLGITEEFDLYTMQEAELRHARLAMLAVVGWPLSELLAPSWMLQENGCAPSVLNGFNPLSFLATVAAFGALGFFEYKTALRKSDDTELGVIHNEDMADVWKWGVAGDYNFDPLNLYSSIGDNAYARKGLREVEISHGRSAMLGITSFAGWEALTGHAIVENSMFFHPNLLLPTLAAAYVAFGQFYEREDSEMYLRYKLSSEGEARLENLKLALGVDKQGDSAATSIDFAEVGDKAKKVVKDFNGLMEKAKEAYMENVVR